jgi:hypothetical protein
LVPDLYLRLAQGWVSPQDWFLEEKVAVFPAA